MHGRRELRRELFNPVIEPRQLRGEQRVLTAVTGHERPERRAAEHGGRRDTGRKSTEKPPAPRPGRRGGRRRRGGAGPLARRRMGVLRLGGLDGLDGGLRVAGDLGCLEINRGRASARRCRPLAAFHGGILRIGHAGQALAMGIDQMASIAILRGRHAGNFGIMRR